jgi:hypothetical protein
MVDRRPQPPPSPQLQPAHTVGLSCSSKTIMETLMSCSPRPFRLQRRLRIGVGRGGGDRGGTEGTHWGRTGGVVGIFLPI